MLADGGLEPVDVVFGLPLKRRRSNGHLTIDLAALGRNYGKLAAILTPSLATAVVKADAYGLGVERVARTLYESGCRHSSSLSSLKLRNCDLYSRPTRRSSC